MKLVLEVEVNEINTTLYDEEGAVVRISYRQLKAGDLVSQSSCGEETVVVKRPWKNFEVTEVIGLPKDKTK